MTSKAIAVYRGGVFAPEGVVDVPENQRVMLQIVGLPEAGGPDDILIACAGGRAGSWSACLPGWGTKWTRSVTTRIEIPGGTA